MQKILPPTGVQSLAGWAIVLVAANLQIVSPEMVDTLQNNYVSYSEMKNSAALAVNGAI
jgi:hypothetical protein